MQPIPTPKTTRFDKQTDSKGQFIIEPLYPGYGLTIGNSLRRVLLSSMPGAAITSIKIDGVEHEFSGIDYVKEDVVDIILNIKQVNLSIEGEIDEDQPLVIKINKTGEAKVTAADFKCPSQVKIVNKDQHLATLTDKAAKFEMECVVEKGMGYLPTENRPGEKLDIGHIAIDAIFTPVNHVNVETDHVRVGEMTNWDKLILTLETNGSITCQAAFDLSVQILVDQFNSLAANKADEKKEEKKKEKSTEEPVEVVKSESEEVVQPVGSVEEKTEDSSDNQEEVTELAPTKERSQQAVEEKPKKRGRPKKESTPTEGESQ